jgi:RNA polymerase sigma-70 factor, ECF subfamily
LLKVRHTDSNREILRCIYQTHRDYLLILAIALSHDGNLAEDAVHDVFVNFAGNFADFNLNGNLKAYLTKCVANRVRDLLRKKQARQLASDEDYPASSDLNEPDRLIICNEQLRLLSSALAKLPYEQREVIVLRMQGGMRFGNIAKSLGVSVNTVKGRYRYGISKLRLALNSEV